MSDSTIVRVSLDSFDLVRPNARQTQVYVQIPEVARASWLLGAEEFPGLRDAEWGDVLDAAIAEYERRESRGLVSDSASAAARKAVREWLAVDENRDALNEAWFQDRARKDPVSRSLLRDKEQLQARVAELETANAGLDDLRVRALDKNTKLRARVDEVERAYTFDTAELKRQLESARVDGQRLIRAEQRTAELEAVLGTHRRDDRAEIERLRKQVAELLAERHSTNEALDDAVQELQARRSLTDAEAAVMWTAVDEATPGHIFKYEYQRIVRAAFGAVGIPLAGADEDKADESADKLARLLAPSQALREDEPGSEPPLTVFRASHDSIVMGLYTTREAAREHCETLLRREEPDAELAWTDDDGVDALTFTVGGEFQDWSGYVVTPLEVASAYDPDGDE